MYADDTMVLSDSKIGLQGALNSLGKCCTHWKLKVNVEKTKFMIFGKRKLKKDNNFMHNNI